jgi:hypothetical protein
VLGGVLVDEPDSRVECANTPDARAARILSAQIYQGAADLRFAS